MAGKGSIAAQKKDARIYDLWRKIHNPIESRRISYEVRRIHHETRKKIVRRGESFVWKGTPA